MQTELARQIVDEIEEKLKELIGLTVMKNEFDQTCFRLCVIGTLDTVMCMGKELDIENINIKPVGTIQ